MQSALASGSLPEHGRCKILTSIPAAKSDISINASSNIISQSVIGVTVTKVANDFGGFQLVADLKCFSANSFPEIWDLKVDFNKTINGTSE